MDGAILRHKNDGLDRWYFGHVSLSRWIPPATLFIIAILSRLPFTTRLLYNQDSVQFALALKDFDVYRHQPHPPGYFLYVLLGEVVNFFIGDANTSFVSISVVASGLVVVTIYYLGRVLFSERIGWWAGVLAITSPLLWFFGEVALNYIVAAFINAWVALLCWQVLQEKNEKHYLAAILLGVGAGIRQDLLIFLFPLWIFCHAQLGLRKLFFAVVILGLTVAVWFVPMLSLSGGAERYFAAVRELWEFHNSYLAIWNAPIESRVDIVLTILGFLSYGAGIGAVFLAFGLYAAMRTGYWRQIAREKIVFFALWFLPAIFFYFLIFLHPYNHAHGHFFLPGVFVLLPLSICFTLLELERVIQVSSGFIRRTETGMILGILTLNLAVFCLSHLSYSANNLQAHERNLAIILSGIKKNFDSKNTILVDARSSLFYGYRHAQYYLPDFTVYLLDQRVNKRGEKWHIFGASNGRTFLSGSLQISTTTKYIVYLMDPSDQEYKEFLRSENVSRLSLDNKLSLYYREIVKNH